jgi:hypothetical protein
MPEGMPYKDSPAVKPLGGGPMPVAAGGDAPVDADHEAKLDGADRLIAATQSGDREQVAAAFEDMYRICAAAKSAAS